MIDSTRSITVCTINKRRYQLIFEHHIHTDEPYIKSILYNNVTNEVIETKEIHIYDYLYFIHDFQKSEYRTNAAIQYIIPETKHHVPLDLTLNDIDYVNTIINAHIMTNINLLYEKKSITINDNSHPKRASYVDYKEKLIDLNTPFKDIAKEINILTESYNALMRYFAMNDQNPTVYSILNITSKGFKNIKGLGKKGQQLVLEAIDAWCTNKGIHVSKYPLYR